MFLRGRSLDRPAPAAVLAKESHNERQHHDGSRNCRAVSCPDRDQRESLNGAGPYLGSAGNAENDVSGAMMDVRRIGQWERPMKASENALVGPQRPRPSRDLVSGVKLGSSYDARENFYSGRQTKFDGTGSLQDQRRLAFPQTH